MNTSAFSDTGDRDPISQEVMELVESIFGCVLIYVFAFLGLAGTAINLLVLSKYNITTDSSNILLLSLSVADFMFCLTIPVSRSKCILLHLFNVPTALRVNMVIFEHFSVFSRVFYCSSISMVGVISVERFLAVFLPFKTSRILTPFRMKCVSVFVYAANLLLFSPPFFSFTHDLVYSEKYNDFVPVLKPTEFYRNNFHAINIEVGIAYNIGVLGTALLLTMVLTPAIGIKLWMATNERTKMTNRKCRFEIQVAKILLIVCTMSLVIYGPFICYQAAIVFLPQFSSMTNSFQVFLIVTDFSGTISASVNFIIYVTMSGKYRQKYKELVLNTCIAKRNKKNQKVKNKYK